MKLLLCFSSGHGSEGEECMKIVMPGSWAEYVDKVRRVASETLGVSDCPLSLLRMTYVDPSDERCTVTRHTYETFCEDLKERAKGVGCIKVFVQFIGDIRFPDVQRQQQQEQQHQHQQQRRRRVRRHQKRVAAKPIPLPRAVGATGVVGSSYSSGSEKEGADNTHPHPSPGQRKQLYQQHYPTPPQNPLGSSSSIGRNKSSIGYSASSTPYAPLSHNPIMSLSDISLSHSELQLSPLVVTPLLSERLLNACEAEHETEYQQIIEEERSCRKEWRVAQQLGGLVLSLVRCETAQRLSIVEERTVSLQEFRVTRTRNRPPSAPRQLRERCVRPDPLPSSAATVAYVKPSPPAAPRNIPSSAPPGRRVSGVANHSSPPLPLPLSWHPPPLLPALAAEEADERLRIQFLAETDLHGLESMHTRLWIQSALAMSRRELEIEQGQVMSVLGGLSGGGEGEGGGGGGRRASGIGKEDSPGISSSGSSAAGQRGEGEAGGGAAPLRPSSSLSCIADWPRKDSSQRRPAPDASAVAPLIQAALPFVLWPILHVLPDLKDHT